MVIKNKKIILLIFSFIIVLGILIPIGFASGYDSENTFFDNSRVKFGSSTLKNTIDKANYYCSKSCPSGKICKSNTPLCKRATTLHTETCNQTSDYCVGAGYSNGDTITYGNTTTTDGNLITGDAFDCDVNGDGTYNPATERFYYVSDYYDTDTLVFNENVAVLVYYSNVRGGVSDTEGTAYDCSNNSYNGPVTAKEQLPTISQWSNVRLYKDRRQILGFFNERSVSNLSLPTNFSYDGYSARLLTFQEVDRGCYSTTYTTWDGAFDEMCQFLMEGTTFSNNSSGIPYVWLETPAFSSSSDTQHSYSLGPKERSVESPLYANKLYGVYPAIEVLKADILY